MRIASILLGALPVAERASANDLSTSFEFTDLSGIFTLGNPPRRRRL